MPHCCSNSPLSRCLQTDGRQLGAAERENWTREGETEKSAGGGDFANEEEVVGGRHLAGIDGVMMAHSFSAEQGIRERPYRNEGPFAAGDEGRRRWWFVVMIQCRRCDDVVVRGRRKSESERERELGRP